MPKLWANLEGMNSVRLTFLEDWRANNLNKSFRIQDGWDPTTGTFPSIAATEDAKGWAYYATANGTVDGVAFNTDDWLVSVVDSPSSTTFAANWKLFPGSNTVGIAASGSGGLVGSWDPSSGSFPAGGGLGSFYYTTGAGTVDGQTFAANQLLLGIAASPSTTTYASNWLQIHNPANAAGVTYDNSATPSITSTDVQGAIQELAQNGWNWEKTSADWNPGGGTFPSSATTRGTPVVRATADATVDGVEFRTGDLLVAIVDNPSSTTYAGNWIKLNNDDTAATLPIDTSSTTRLASTDTQSAILELADKLLCRVAAGWDASVGTFPTPNVMAGDRYEITTGGIVSGVVLNAGDILEAQVDNADSTTYAGNWTLIPSERSRGSLTHTRTQAAHGFTLPTEGFLPVYLDDADGLWKLAQANAQDTLKAAYVVEIPDVNTLVIQHMGLHYAPAHGLTVGEYYFLSSAAAGGIVATEPTISDVLAFVISADEVFLYDNRPFDTTIITQANNAFRIIDADADTYVRTESAAAADEDNIDIFAGGVDIADISATGMVMNAPFTTAGGHVVAGAADVRLAGPVADSTSTVGSGGQLLGSLATGAVQWVRYDSRRVAKVSANTLVTGGPGDPDTYLVDTTAGLVTMTLETPADGQEGLERTIKDTGNAGTANIAIIVQGGKSIDGVVGLTINTNYDKVTVIYDGTNWITV